MKTELSKITQDLEQGIITDKEARSLLLGLLCVSSLLPLDEVKYRATRFAHQCRLKGVVTNNDTVNLYDELYGNNS